MLSEVLKYIFWGNSVKAYLVALATILLIFIILKIIRFFVVRHLAVLAKKTATTFDDFFVLVINKVVIPFLSLGAVYVGVNTLSLAPYLKKAVNVFGVALLTIFTAKLVVAFVNYGFKLYFRNVGKDTVLERSLTGMLRIVKVLIWGIALIFLLDNLGFKISTVIAGLGIGGVAVALAAQAVLKDLFSYISIIFDRPFEVGDFVIVGDMLGTIEYIGIKTTRIRSLGGEQLIFSNSDLTDSRLRNYKRMKHRRVVFKLGV
ncbi:MAG: mechanosensitive ion channel domain-containing protein, partial [Candidatus Omnitrophota bacterium]